MTDSGHIALIDRLRAMPTETEWFEFKHNHWEPQLLGEYLSALANSACLAGQPQGYLLFGIDDTTHEVAGTQFDPYAVKAKGNQDLLPWLAAGCVRTRASRLTSSNTPAVASSSSRSVRRGISRSASTARRSSALARVRPN